MYADDVQVYYLDKPDNLHRIEHFLNQDLDRINIWAKRNSLALNIQKTTALNIKASQRDCEHPKIILDGLALDFVTSARNLGLIIDQNLKWQPHISSVCAKIYASLRSIRVACSDLPISIKLHVCRSLIVPHVIYCDTIYGSASAEVLRPLRKAINVCLRFIYGLNGWTSVSHLQTNLLGLPFNRFFDYRRLLNLHSMVHGNAPLYLKSYITFGHSTRQNLLCHMRTRTEGYKRTTIPHSISLWNQLPINLRLIKSKTIFKEQIKNFLSQLDIS
jgi:hypothetical protein